jgi:nitrogen fixation negative regulator NifL
MLEEKLRILEAALSGLEDPDGVVKATLRQLADINYALDESLIVAVTDVRGNITFANKMFCKISKYSRDELLGQNHRIVNSGYHSREFFREMWRTIANGRIWRGEIKNKAKDGTFYWMDTTIVPCLNEQGKPYQYVSFRNEITPRKLAEEQLQTLIATMPDIVIFLDGEGRWLKANRAALSFFGLSGTECQGKPAEAVLPLARLNREALRQFLSSDDARREGRTLQFEEEVRLSDGSTRVFEMTKVPAFHNDGKPSGLIVIGKDITEKKQTEAFLRRVDKIYAVGEMASGIAHEIRNPLAAMKWSLQLLRMDNPENDHQFAAILSELERVDSIVGELLMLAKPHATRFEMVQLEEVLQIVVTLMNSQARRAHVALKLVVDSNLPPVRCEPNQLKQVFINLIKNAIEAMPNGGEICIQAAKANEDEVVVRVADQGCGIPDEVIQRLGEPFFSTKENGTGLGMMICHKIIQDHGGRLDIRSKVNKGTVVSVVLPVSGKSQSTHSMPAV